MIYELVEFFYVVSDSGTYEMKMAATYVKRLMQLFSNVCFGRNYANIKIIKKIFKMQILVEYIWNSTLPEEVRASLVSLLLHLHIDVKPRTVKIVPLLCKNFSAKIQNFPNKKSVVSPVEPAQKVFFFNNLCNEF